MSFKQLSILLTLFLCQSFSLSAQDYREHNWYFSGNNNYILFGKGPRVNATLQTGKVPLNNIGEKLVVSYSETGDVLFYSDGTNIYDGTDQIMVGGSGIDTDLNGVQKMASTPIPGQFGEGFQWMIHRNAAGEILYTRLEPGARGNRTEGPPAGISITGPEKNNPTGITNRTDGMLVIGATDQSTYWLITQNAITRNIEIHEVPNLTGNFNLVGIVNLTNDQLVASHFSFHPATGRIAVIPENGANIEILVFNENEPALITSETTILNSFVANESFGGSAGWSASGHHLYFSRNGNNGGLYRYDIRDTMPFTNVELVNSYIDHQSLSLKLAPDSAIYHITRDIQSGIFQLNKINEPDSALDRIEYETALFEGYNPESAYFSQSGVMRTATPSVRIGVQSGDLCQNSTIQFFGVPNPPSAIPTRVLWNFPTLGIQSNALSPIITAETPGEIMASLTAEIDGLIYSDMRVITILENTLQLTLPDTTICLGETLTLDAEPQSSGGGAGGGGNGGTYTYLWSTGETTQTIDVSESGDYWVVVTPQGGGCPVYGTGRVTVYGDEGQTANIWYFGNGAGIDFNEEDGLDPPPRSIAEAHAMDAPAGTSTISDANGDVLFYTNGSTVWNRENEVMENGEDIGGDSTSVQAALIIPLPSDETIYYIFTTEEVYGEESYRLSYSIVDTKFRDNNGGNGRVLEKDILLFAKSTERLTSFEGGDGFWLLSHEFGNNTFRAYPITAEGIGVPVVSSFGGVHTLNDPMSAKSGMKFSNDGQRVAVSIIDGSDDYVEIFDFDPATGEILEFNYRIDLNEGGSSNDEVYDVHFSPAGNKLYATMNNRAGGGAGGRILEYRIDSFSTEQTRRDSRTDISLGSNLNVNFGQIQTGPNGALYVAVETPGNPGGSAFVSSINVNEDTTGVSGISPQAVALTVGNSRLGLPNFVQNNANPSQEPALSAPTEVCVEQRIEMSGAGTSDIDVFFWSITDQDDNSTVFSAEGQDTAYVFAADQSGLFNISLNITNRCGLDTTLVQAIEVLATPDPPLVPQAIAICEGQPQQIDALGDPNASAAGLTFEWTNSQGQVVSTTRSYLIETQEIYTVTISNALGCSSSAEIFAGPPFEIQLPEASTICQDASLTLDPQVTANNYIWTVIRPDNSTVTLPNRRRATVDSSVPGEFLYVVSIEDPISVGCFVNDTTRVTINPLAQGNAANIVNPACGSTNGSFEFNITTTGNYSYVVTGNSTGVVAQNNSTDGPTTELISNLAADTYSVAITDNSSGCVNTIPDIQVQNNPPDFSITSTTLTDADCSNPTGSLLVTLSANVFPISYVLTNNTDGTSTNGTVNAAIPASTFDFSVTGLSGGTYDLEVTSNGGCVQSQTGIIINQPQPVNLITEPFVEVCGPSAPLSASATPGGATFTWTGPNGFSANGANVNSPVSGTYTVTATAAGACPVSQEVVVELTIQPIVQINEVGDVCDGQVILEAEVTNAQSGATYNYNWSNGATSRTITVNTSDTYTVTARHADNLNCSGNASTTITIPDEIEASVSSSPACDDSSPVTLAVNVTAGSPNSFTWTRDGQATGLTGSTVNVNDEGAYTVTISNGTCSIERSINVRRQAIPAGLLPKVEYFCPTRTNNPILLAGRGFESYEWTLDGQPYPQGGRTLTVTGPGEYVVTMTTSIGCVRTDTVTIIESCDPEVIAPNAFAPSSNPPNNTFSVFPNDFVDNFEIFIYTRWGELIYQSNTLEFKWDGTFNGQPVPLGTYPYVMRFTSRFEPERGQFEQKGAVSVIR